MCKIDVEFCNSPEVWDPVDQMIMGLREAAPDAVDDDEWGPDSAQQMLERGPR